jgi:phage FluMu gp28-like protein
MAKRPKYVAADFAGGCKVFPKATSDGREPILLGYQGKWVKDESRLKIAEKSRQIGWTWSEAYGIDRALSQKDARLDHWISSRDDIQARLFLEDCKAFASLLQIGAADLGEKVIDEDGHSAHVLEFATGKRAHSMSSNPDAQAGKRGGRTLDEGALHKDLRKLYGIAYHGITWGGGLSIFSTHRGTANYFNQLILEVRHKGNPKGFSLHRVTLQDALDAGLLYKLQKKLPLDDPRQKMDEAEYFDFIRAGCPDEESFLQECMCVPSDDESAFISYELIDGCKYAPGEAWEYSMAQLAACTNPLYLGVDVGRKHDRFVAWLDEVVGGVAFTRKLLVLQNKTFSAMEAELYPLLDLPRMQRCCIDNTGLGMQFAERAQERFGKYKVEPVTFTGPVKEELAYPVRASLEDRSCRMPDLADITADFRAIRKETTAAGNIRFKAEAGPTGHSDRFWAKALARHAAKATGQGYSSSLC